MATELGIIDDPNAEARSLMNRAPCICNGEQNGIPCTHYWNVIQKFRASNADGLRSGEKQRACTLTDGLVLEFTEDEKPTFCGRYEPRKTRGLVAITKRAVRTLVGLSPHAGHGYEAYNKDFEEFRPMTVAEIARNREAFPDKPVAFGVGGKNPAMWTADDIMNGPQIGILKPGEKPPSTTLSDETEAGLDGIFGKSDDGIFKK